MSTIVPGMASYASDLFLECLAKRLFVTVQSMLFRNLGDGRRRSMRVSGSIGETNFGKLE